MKALLVILSSFVLASCGSTSQQEPRTPVPPPGSDEYGSIPWNDPGQGPRPGGVLGDMMEGR
jgi:hypothetical protein